MMKLKYQKCSDLDRIGDTNVFEVADPKSNAGFF